MKIRIENIGVIRYAEVEMGKLTVLCGINNSGKTYVTYALYGFLFFWNNMFHIPIGNEAVKKLKDSGVCFMSADEYAALAPRIIEQAYNDYTNQLSSVFSAQKNKFRNSTFKIDVSAEEVAIMERDHSGGISSPNTKTKLTYHKNANEDEIAFTLFTEENGAREIPDFIVSQTMSQAIKEIVFGSVFPNTFIASAERTGAAIFRRELNFARNKILDAISKKDSEIDPLFLLREGKSDYAWPVDHNVDFVRNLEDVSKSESDIYINHKTIIDDFYDILGGNFQITDKDEILFTPTYEINNKIQLTMDESSSSVRSLLDIGFYLKHVARFGDLLMIDEPELNLHPKNQRKLARLLASLINSGLKIFITTHSDYILRELSNLILLGGSSSHLSEIITREGYKNEELMKASDLKIYTAQEGSVVIPNGKRKTTVKTLVPVPVDDEYGIHSSSFDDVINEMNRITDDIMLGRY